MQHFARNLLPNVLLCLRRRTTLYRSILTCQLLFLLGYPRQRLGVENAIMLRRIRARVII